ncbi:hypothetical protein HPB49_023466 [Dermacentor silvarum]|uniref:Uncharacterized protein n=1 Tax=Dermacentor silvarum TaxID=543639 RepID=A0ACB8CBZ4_DERSI|nr:hypothetical protein HPB49_023466 [Dermacentor silvarum]
MAGPDHVPTLAERLYQAAVAGQTDTVVELCRIGARIEADAEGRTALHMAAANGYVDTARALILAGAKVNALDAVSQIDLRLTDFARNFNNGGIVKQSKL